MGTVEVISIRRQIHWLIQAVIPLFNLSSRSYGPASTPLESPCKIETFVHGVFNCDSGCGIMFPPYRLHILQSFGHDQVVHIWFLNLTVDNLQFLHDFNKFVQRIRPINPKLPVLEYHKIPIIVPALCLPLATQFEFTLAVAIVPVVAFIPTSVCIKAQTAYAFLHPSFCFLRTPKYRKGGYYFSQCVFCR